ncbi:hypothetical protein UFOVP144_14 [uncultured Caudovirales phage]|uniref:Uncharacterized protein n=1 Tax=uncultured Caudovirales phage TaxID=2100421 RepID=A0A6J7XNU5_9CAUD|nr:hypothetical protein UFOVP144_14 [uncultured Caudovirales phage]
MSEQAELDFEYKGTQYLVLVEYDVVTVDNSFDGHRDGYVYTFESSHKEVDLKTVSIDSCIGDDDEQVDPYSVPGLVSHIKSILEDNPEDYAR